MRLPAVSFDVFLTADSMCWCRKMEVMLKIVSWESAVTQVTITRSEISFLFYQGHLDKSIRHQAAEVSTCQELRLKWDARYFSKQPEQLASAIAALSTQELHAG